MFHIVTLTLLIPTLKPPDYADVYERYMSGTIDGDVEKLAKLIGELLI
jgi:hypothetical protein